MIVTLTANPALDRTIVLDGGLLPGAVQTAVSQREDAGGKGVNVSRACAGAGVPTIAVVPLSAEDPYAAALRATGLPTRVVPVHGQVRTNLALTDAEGVTTKINLPGEALDVTDRGALIAALVEAARGATWVVLAGSTPPGVGEDFYVDVIASLRGDAARAGIAPPRIAVDTSGPALSAVVESAHPDLIKPNDEELAQLAGARFDPGRELRTEVVRVARALVPAKVAAALVTLGEDGAILVTGDTLLHAAPPPITVRSTVGAGDSSLAGYLLADAAGAEPDERLRNAVRYGAAAASLPGTQIPTPRDLPSGEVALTPLAP
ncbi:1-phosphofructokinase family hexose kinase [Microbacterium sp. LRZ72]|uniref:1-phosphofructokinase family hexose kinase n=1 Tax=Microbacterium sp. LRZ72 TaxID=2942481 RepID=UPI0029A8FD2E|nr:1-phosphofructokinase [Microbacterium sp. LRZ72]MDX2375618.1 1-phosphofructokinase family hexose kinase [Microbacterium sp. LRZ72]